MHVRGAATRAQATYLYNHRIVHWSRSFAYSGDSADCRFAYINICRLHLLQLYLNSAVEYAGLTQSEGWGSVTLCSLRHSQKAKRPWRHGDGRTIVDPVESLIGDERPPGAMPSVRLAPSLLLHQRMHRPRRSARREASRSQAQPLPYLGGGTRLW